jgi:hypothetical protein
MKNFGDIKLHGAMMKIITFRIPMRCWQLERNNYIRWTLSFTNVWTAGIPILNICETLMTKSDFRGTHVK